MIKRILSWFQKKQPQTFRNLKPGQRFSISDNPRLDKSTILYKYGPLSERCWPNANATALYENKEYQFYQDQPVEVIE